MITEARFCNLAAGSGQGIFHWVSPASTVEASVTLKTLSFHLQVAQRYILINLTGYCSHSQCLHSIILYSTSFCLIFTPQGSLCLTIQPRLRDILEPEHPKQKSSWDMSGQTLSKLGISQCFFSSLSFHMAGTLRHTTQSDSQACTHWDMTQRHAQFFNLFKVICQHWSS